jgi:hypothetical protein
LKLAIAEMYLTGVSTRRVQDITEKLCGYEVSSTQVSRITQELDGQFEQFRNRPVGEVCYLVADAIYLKVRHNGSVIDMAVLFNPTSLLQPHYQSSSLIQVDPSQLFALVLLLHGFFNLCFSLSIEAAGSRSSAQEPESESRHLYAGCHLYSN